MTFAHLEPRDGGQHVLRAVPFLHKEILLHAHLEAGRVSAYEGVHGEGDHLFELGEVLTLDVVAEGEVTNVLLPLLVQKQVSSAIITTLKSTSSSKFNFLNHQKILIVPGLVAKLGEVVFNELVRVSWTRGRPRDLPQGPSQKAVQT